MLLSSLVFFSLLTSCKPNTLNKVLVPIINTTINDDNYLREINREKLDVLVNSKKTFVLYFGSPDCRYCQELSPLLKDYILRTKIEVYYIDGSTENTIQNYPYLRDQYGLRGTPILTIFKNGEIKHQEVGNAKLKTAIALTNFFKEHIFTSAYFIVNETAIIGVEKSVSFYYDFENQSELLVINTYFFPHFNKKGFLTYIIDTPTTEGSFRLKFAKNTDDTLLDTTNETLLQIEKQYLEYFE